MQQPSRRQFVTASLAGLPVLALDGSAALTQGQSAAPRPVSGEDPVLDQINANLRDLIAEGQAKPAARKEVMRALEATLGVQAAHIAQHYDAPIREALRQRERRAGRAVLVEELVAAAGQRNLPNVTHQLADEVVSRIARHGVSGFIRDGQRSLRAIRLRAPDALQAASLTSRAQYDFCSDLVWILQLAEMAAALTCILALSPGFLLLEPICLSLQAYIALLLLLKMWFC